jgi:SM-20-related protein
LNTSLLTHGRGPFDGDVFSRIVEALFQDGYIILNGLFSDEQLQGLFIDIKQTDSRNFHPAGIGRDQTHQLNRFVRRDRIYWLETDYVPAQFYLDWSEQLRQRLNRELFLGLFDFECHYAHYPTGAFYKRHRDAFRGFSNRRLSSILYLNPDWQPNDGGELVLYGRDENVVLETVLPTFGTTVLFLSEDFPHEVLPASRSRYSLTGWFRVNNTNSLNLDPPQ